MSASRPQLPEMRYPGACLGGTVEAALETFDRGAGPAAGASGGATGFEAVRAQWLAKAGPLGLEVDVKLGDELVRGRFAGMDREGALLLDTAAGPRRIVCGRVVGPRGLRRGRAMLLAINVNNTNIKFGVVDGDQHRRRMAPAHRRPCARPTSMPSG